MTEYRFYRESTGEWESVSPERWQWEAHYVDGTVLKQFDESTGLFHQFKEIDQDNLHAFIMTCHGRPPLVLHWKQGYKLIHFYSNIIMNAGTPAEQRVRIYCFGYQNGNNKVIMCIMPDDGMVITHDHELIKVI